MQRSLAVTLLLATIGALIWQWNSSQPDTSDVFTFHIIGEPNSLDPARATGLSGSYLFGNLYRGLYRYNPHSGLEPEGAKKCTWHDGYRKLICRLNPRMKWSDGTQVLSNHYVRAFRRIMDPSIPSIQPQLLLQLKNARAILDGNKPPEALGVKAPNRQKLVFVFDKRDVEFKYKLTNPALTPVKKTPIPAHNKAHKKLTTGPYKIKNWTKGERIQLIPNEHYPFGHPQRPKVEVLILKSDSTALRLYSHGRLSLLRRLPTSEIPQYKDRKDFFQVPLARFDYLGFSPELKKKQGSVAFRKALALSLKYSDLKKLYHALGIPGCPSLPSEYTDRKVCHRYQPKKAKKVWDKVPGKLKNKKWILGFSKMGGQDVRKGMEWIQHQWKQNLGLDVELRSIEQGMYIQRLKHDPPDMFRKGIGLNRPTCLAALEVFRRDGRENYIDLHSSKYEQIVRRMKSSEEKAGSKKLCRQGVEVLVKNYHMIPMGEIHFSMLARRRFQGWSLNSLNHLDLSKLHITPTQQRHTAKNRENASHN